MSKPVVRSHTLFVWPNECTQVQVEVFYTEGGDGGFVAAGVKVDILRPPAPSPHVEFRLGRLPSDLVEGRADAVGATGADLMFAGLGWDPQNITLGEATAKPRTIERGGEEAKIVANVTFTSASILLTVADWNDVLEVSIENDGDNSAGQYWSVRPKGPGWEFFLR